MAETSTHQKPRLVAVTDPANDAGAAMPVVLAGHVDHGKSTLVGRLFHDTGSLPEGRFEAIQEICRKRGMPFEWAFLTDALQGERDQAVTIDTAHIWFRTETRRYVLLDAPGHHEFLRNMVTGAATAQAALLLVDAEEGVAEQSRRHAYLLNLLGISQLVVVINKMDRVDYDRAKFDLAATEIADYLDGMDIKPAAIVPISAREGDNVAAASERMPWYDGPTVLAALDSLTPPVVDTDLPLRLPIQDVFKFDDRRIIAGRIETGRLRVGDELLFSPSNKTARVTSIEGWPEAAGGTATAGQSIGLMLDAPLFIERGEIASHATRPPIESDVFRAKLLWLGAAPLMPGKSYKMSLNTQRADVRLQAIERVIDVDTMNHGFGEMVGRNDLAEVVLRANRMLALDEYATSPRTGRFVISEGHRIVGAGVIDMSGYPDQRELVTVRATNITEVEDAVGADARAVRNGHRGGILWFTGLSGSGKSTLSQAAEKALFARGYHIYTLDGDNVRHGLNANLGFSPEDRAENIRRVGETAALFADAGMIVLTAFISPYQADRARARSAAERVLDDGTFHEIYIRAGLAACEARDPKGLYKRARAGEIQEFTGISAPYEPPDTPELVIDTEAESIEDCTNRILDYVDRHFVIQPSD